SRLAPSPAAASRSPPCSRHPSTHSIPARTHAVEMVAPRLSAVAARSGPGVAHSWRTPARNATCLPPADARGGSRAMDVPSPAPPTDNLYKFLALGGLMGTLYILSFYAIEGRRQLTSGFELQTEYQVLLLDSERLSGDLKELLAETQDLKARGDKLREGKVQ